MLSGCLLLAGCAADPVALPEVSRQPDEARACEALVADLPAALGDRERVEVTPPGALGAAWGDPPIVLSCGGGVPEDFSETAVCQEVDGVGWYVADEALEDESRDVVLTAVGHRPVVRLEVPAEQRPEGPATAMAELAGPVSEHTELVRPCR